MKNKIVVVLLALFALNIIADGYINDPRVSYSVPFIKADPSLKTTDPFYGGIADNNYTLAPVFLGDIYKREQNKNVLTLHRTIDNESNIKITNATAFDLTEDEMHKANITNGQESWL